ncbi:MAG TPA: ThuA domain-containing protein [Sphingomicrobium sp.]|nr:ThuA domain-containing protein [Sphingomicrobium sp.]
MKILAALVALQLSMISAPALAAQAASAVEQPQVLLFSHSTGYRHESIEPGAEAIKALGAREKLTVIHSEDPDVFSPDGLKNIDAIIFLSSSTDSKKPESEWFQGSRREALQAFVRRGGGVVGIHAASDSHYHWPWYQRLIGGHFARHPEGTPEGTVHVVEPDHRANKGLPESITRVDEWYYFDDYNPQMRLLVTLDPASIGEKDVNPNPISWAHEFEGGRMFYTAMGHTTESYLEPDFLNHLAGGLAWVLNRE